MFLMLNNVDSAIENFNKVVELCPDFAIGHVQKLHTDYRFDRKLIIIICVSSLVETVVKLRLLFYLLRKCMFLFYNLCHRLNEYNQQQNDDDICFYLSHIF